MKLSLKIWFKSQRNKTLLRYFSEWTINFIQFLERKHQCFDKCPHSILKEAGAVSSSVLCHKKSRTGQKLDTFMIRGGHIGDICNGLKRM